MLVVGLQRIDNIGVVIDGILVILFGRLGDGLTHLGEFLGQEVETFLVLVVSFDSLENKLKVLQSLFGQGQTLSLSGCLAGFR